MLTNEQLSELAFRSSAARESAFGMYPRDSYDAEFIGLILFRHEKNIIEAARQLEENLWRENNSCEICGAKIPYPRGNCGDPGCIPF